MDAMRAMSFPAVIMRWSLLASLRWRRALRGRTRPRPICRGGQRGSSACPLTKQRIAEELTTAGGAERLQRAKAAVARLASIDTRKRGGSNEFRLAAASLEECIMALQSPLRDQVGELNDNMQHYFYAPYRTTVRAFLPSMLFALGASDAEVDRVGGVRGHWKALVGRDLASLDIIEALMTNLAHPKRYLCGHARDPGSDGSGGALPGESAPRSPAAPPAGPSPAAGVAPP